MDRQIEIPANHIKIFVEWVNTQTPYRRTLFEAKTILKGFKELSKLIGVLLEKPNFEDDCYFIDCFDKQLQLDVISEIQSRNNKQKFVSERINLDGINMGINVLVTLEYEDLNELQNQRNKLNRKIATLKKANLPN